MLRILEDKLEPSNVEIIFVDKIEREKSGKFSYIKSRVSHLQP